ncbi:MAG: hypothetical protein K0B09_11985 [Bacteroidales bacterium]|nr:hypothetical protein [Bacteroidales bacterium]
MKKKIFALAFVATMTMGLAKTAESGSGGPCQTVSVACPSGTEGPGFTGIVCNANDFYLLLNHYCTEQEVDD